MYDVYGVDLRVLATLQPKDASCAAAQDASGMPSCAAEDAALGIPDLPLRVISNLDGTYTAVFTAIKSVVYDLPILVRCPPPSPRQRETVEEKMTSS